MATGVRWKLWQIFRLICFICWTNWWWQYFLSIQNNATYVFFSQNKSFSWYKGGIWWWIFKLRALTSLCIAFIDSVENLIQGLRLQRWSFIYIKYSNTSNFIVLKFALLYIRVVIITMSTWITIRQINQQRNFGIAQWNWTNKITIVHSSRHWYGNCMTIWHRKQYLDTHLSWRIDLYFAVPWPRFPKQGLNWRAV